MEYTNEELYHYGVLGMKWGVRKHQKQSGSFVRTSGRVARAIIKNPKAAIKNEARLARASLNHPIAFMKYSKNLPTLAFKHRSRWMNVLNKHMSDINGDINKISIGKDFFKNHSNDRVEDILKDGNNAMIAYMLVVDSSRQYH